MHRQKGAAYILMLVSLAVAAVLIASTNTLVSTQIKRVHENELIFRGLQYRLAIKRYYEASTPPEYPREMTHLLKDPRFVNKRHLRKFYADPFWPMDESEEEGGFQWTEIRNEHGRIIGVSSRSSATGLKRANFPVGVQLDGEGETYAQWHFVFLPEPRQAAPLIKP